MLGRASSSFFPAASCERMSAESGLEEEEGAMGFLEGPKARRRSRARSRYSGVLVAGSGWAEAALASLVVALVTRSEFWRLSRWS